MSDISHLRGRGRQAGRQGPGGRRQGQRGRHGRGREGGQHARVAVQVLGYRGGVHLHVRVLGLVTLEVDLRGGGVAISSTSNY